MRGAQVQRRRRLVLGFDTWQDNVRMMRKYRRIFMARIMRMNRQRLERSIDRWVENFRHARGARALPRLPVCLVTVFLLPLPHLLRACT